MKSFLAFIRKEFFHILRDRRTLLILIGIPVVQIILFGFAITTEVQNVNVAVWDPSRDDATLRLTERFDASRYFTVKEQLSSPADIETCLLQGRADMAIVFEERFNENLLHTGHASVQLITDATDPNTSTLMTNYASGVIASYQQELMQEQGIPMQIVPNVKMLFNPQMKGAYNFVPGVMGLILMIICAMMTSISIVREKERGTMEVLLVSPVRPISIIVAKAIPYFVLSCVNLVTILLLSVYVLGVPVVGSLALLAGLSMIFILVSLALGLLISTLVRTQVAAMLASGMGLILPVIILSGLMFPIESMPKVLQVVSNIVPARWYIAAVRKVMIEGLGAAFIAKELLILSGMALLLIGVSLKKFKNRL